MLNNNYINENNMNMHWHMDIWHMQTQHVGGWLAPYKTITGYKLTWPYNKAIWARRTK